MNLPRLIASGFGSGFFPWAPGTAGSVAALAVGAALLLASPWLLLAAAALAGIGGVWAVRAAQAGDDPGWVVVDEFAGQWLTLLGLPALSWRGALAAFLLFRLLDIAKPGPIGWADRRPGPVGVMADDVIAGVSGALILAALARLWPGLLD